MTACAALAGSGRLVDGDGAALRPGDAALTQRLAALAGFRAGDVIADIGCGRGISAAVLREVGLDIVGIDRDAEAVAEAGAPALVADAVALPFADGELDGVLAECVLSLLDRSRALAEWARVLRPGGALALADLYAHAESGAFATAAEIAAALAGAGLTVEHHADRSDLLAGFVGRFVFAHGSLAGLWGDCVGAEAARRARPGYGLWIARKPMKNRGGGR
jgi:SAM-dependent methyltransferase